jgi:hypothetical protein
MGIALVHVNGHACNLGMKCKLSRVTVGINISLNIYITPHLERIPTKRLSDAFKIPTARIQKNCLFHVHSKQACNVSCMRLVEKQYAFNGRVKVGVIGKADLNLPMKHYAFHAVPC